MEASVRRLTILLFVACLCAAVCSGQDIIEMHCDPSISHRFEACPAGYCCTRDEFLPTYVYCKKIGQVSDACTTRATESECPCGAGLRCKPNVDSHSFTSLYGKCVNASQEN